MIKPKAILPNKDKLAYTSLTKREHFAGLAMQGLASNIGGSNVNMGAGADLIAAASLALADALLYELQDNPTHD